MKAIETEYRGYRFRSRLEARWAVFFDALGLDWQYEPEGFDLLSGRYLPDFRVIYPQRAGSDLPRVWWFECKPHLALIDRRDWIRIREFDSDCPLIVLDGVPDDRLYQRASEACAAAGESGLRDGWSLWSSHYRPWYDEASIWFGPSGGRVDIADELLGAITVARNVRFEALS